MKTSNPVEVRLERSLRNQIVAPKLARSFDAAVWARIEAQQAPVVATRSAGARWLAASNAIGVCAVVAVLLYFGRSLFSGVEIGAELPRVPTFDLVAIIKASTWPVTALALLVGLSFTSLGRRLRAELS